ncbi:MAG: M20/M25/M40 family metallo-hydrolase [Acidobacteriota bacterium]
MRRLRVPAIFVLAVALQAAAIDPNRYLAHVKYLASPELKGRGTGAPGLEKAAGYIARRLRSFGLKPEFQPFPVTVNARLGAKNGLETVENGHKSRLKPGQDFVPFNFSSSGTVSGGLVFAGYGITAPEYHYDDYAGIDVKGKIVVVLRHEPQEFDEKSVFAGKILTEHAQFWSKAVNAKRHGAAAVILVNDGAHHAGEPAELEKFGRAVGPVDAGILFLQVKPAAADRWFAPKTLERLTESIDKDLKPESFALPESVRISATVDVERDLKTVRNIYAYLAGQTDEYVIIGAHYDHLGLGEQFSMAPSEAGKPHPGADDNASGTAGLLELARWFASQPKQRRGVLFLAFAGEELGLLGSRYYVDHPELPLAKAVAMINLDMIGRLRDGKVYIGGEKTGSNFKELLDADLPKHHLNPEVSSISEAGLSDHQSFTTKQVPVLFFFSGLHADYHKPSDTWDKIDAPHAAVLLDAVADVAATLAGEAGRPQFVKVAEPPPGPVGGAGGGYEAWFGGVPDFGEVPKGVKFADVTAGSPAAAAGLKAGDILVEFDGKPIGNLYDLTYALRGSKPGDRVAVKVLRGTETVPAEVVLGQRK